MKAKTITKLKKNYPYYDDSLDIEERINLLLNRLTLKEKFKLLSAKFFSLWRSKSIRRLKVPCLGMTDGPNGVGLHSGFKRATKYPCSKCASATWNRELMLEYGESIAKEVRAVGRHVLLAPGVNIDRTPLNGRTFEYFSEDPYLTKEIAIPFVNGVQNQKIAACVKHFAVNNQETNRFTVSAEVDDRTLNEIYLRAFRDIVKATDPWSFMGSYNKINGVYGCENRELIHDYLMDQWGFTGYVVTDWFATKHYTAPEASIKAGLSLEMPKTNIYSPKLLQQAFDEGKFSKEELDFVIRRLLRVMFRVGLFDAEENLPKGELNTKAAQDIAKRIAHEGIVLLKNEDKTLPLKEDDINSIYVAGRMSDRKMGKILFGGSAAVVPPFEISPLKAIINRFGKEKLTKDPAKADYCLIFAGLTHNKKEDCENIDRETLELSEKQIKLIKNTIAKNPKTVVVLLSGSPISMEKWIKKIPAIVLAWHPGMMGGEAIVDVLFGDVNPSGKLPITFPKKLKDSPAHKSKKTFPGDEKVFYEEGIFVGYRHFDKEKIEPLFPFGFGLSYSLFHYSNLVTSASVIAGNQSLEVLVDVTNSSKVKGSEVVQLYIRDDECSLERPVKELKRFEKVTLEPKETKTVTFEITADDLKFYEPKNKMWINEYGTHKIMIGSSSRDIFMETAIEYARES